MAFPLRSRRARVLALVLAVFVILGAVLWFSDSLTPLPDTTEYRGAGYSFSYPRAFGLEEYGRDAASVGERGEDRIVPLVDVAIYRNDPDTPPPATYAAFLDQQARNLCGSDGGGEAVTCSDVVAERYVSPRGYIGQRLSMTLTRRNLASGTTTVGAFAPIYAFDLTQGQATTSLQSRYEALFVYPSLESQLAGTANPDLLATIIGSLASPTIPLQAGATTTPAAP